MSHLFVAPTAGAVVVAIAFGCVFVLLRPKKRCLPIKKASDILTAEDHAYTKRATQILLTLDQGSDKGAIDTYTGQAAMISKLLASGLVDVDGLLRQNAHDLFLLHREAGPVVEGGLGVRVTVQLNLFGGSVANLGSPTQREWLQGAFNRGELGCFCLTERGAGVVSGLIVNTTATFVAHPSPHFELHSPTDASRKTWISQGLTARWGVVIARLFVPAADSGNLDSTSADLIDKGPHAFLVDMTAEGCRREDMPSKIDFNSLDNANVWFEHMHLGLDGLLSGISSVDETGAYHLTDPAVPFRFVEVAQRLLSGRICIAGAAIKQAQKVVQAVRVYSQRRLIPTGRDETTPLAQLPVMRDTLESIEAVMLVLRHFTKTVEDAFIQDKTISAGLVHRIACGKIEAVGFCIDAILALKARVGSLSLQNEGPFGSKTDILYVYRFAEGDTSILRQKMARDRLKDVASRGVLGLLMELFCVPYHYLLNKGGLGAPRAELSLGLVRLALSMMGKSGSRKLTAWFEAHREVERIAQLHALLTIHDTVAEREGLRDTRELHLFKEYYF